MSQPNDNPFQAPIQSSATETSVPANDEVLDFIALAKKWEKYRLIYNGILVVETVVLGLLNVGFNGGSFFLGLFVLAIFGAIACNFFFLLGPVLDGYCQWIFRSRNEVFGLIILVLGTLFSALLAAITVLGSSF